MVAVRNSTHYGTAGFYTEMAAKAGCIGVSGTNARPSIAPTFSVQNKLGTNPLAFAFPTDEEFPFSLDCRSEEHTSELQSRGHLVCRLLLEKKKKKTNIHEVVNEKINTRYEDNAPQPNRHELQNRCDRITQ